MRSLIYLETIQTKDVMTAEKTKMDNITDEHFKKLFVTGLLKRCKLFSPTQLVKVFLSVLVLSSFIYLMNIHSSFIPQVVEIIDSGILTGIQ